MSEMFRLGICQFSSISRKSTGKGDGVVGVRGRRALGGRALSGGRENAVCVGEAGV